MQPDRVVELVHHGSEVIVEAGAGAGAGSSDEEYEASGARIVGSADEVFAAADMIVKVKEPLPAEYGRFREGQMLFTYLHLAADARADRAPDGRRSTAIAYETIQLADGEPAAAHPDERGRRPDGHPGRRALPGEPAGRRGHPARRRPRRARGRRRHPRRRRRRHERGKIAVGMRRAASPCSTSTSTGCATSTTSSAARRRRSYSDSRHASPSDVRGADLVIGAVLIPGAKAPELVTAEMIAQMKHGLRHRRRRGRPGRLHRDQPADHPRQPDLRRRRRRPLLRGQHARRGPRTSTSRSPTPPCPTWSRSPTRASRGRRGRSAAWRGGLSALRRGPRQRAVAEAHNLPDAGQQSCLAPGGSARAEGMTRDASTVVVGGGIWGMSTAYHLARAG